MVSVSSQKQALLSVPVLTNLAGNFNVIFSSLLKPSLTESSAYVGINFFPLFFNKHLFVAGKHLADVHWLMVEDN